MASQGAPGTGQPQTKGGGGDAQHCRCLGCGEPVQDGECDRFLVSRAQERPGCSDVRPTRNEIGVVTSVRGTVPDFGEADRDGIVPVLAATGVLEGLAGHAEEPGARGRRVGRDVVEAAPRDEHDITDNVLGMSWMHTSAYETKQIDVRRVVDVPEALFTLPLRRSRGFHALLLSKRAQVCHPTSPVPLRTTDVRICRDPLAPMSEHPLGCERLSTPTHGDLAGRGPTLVL